MKLNLENNEVVFSVEEYNNLMNVLNNCQKDRHDLEKKVDKLQEEIIKLTQEVSNLTNQLNDKMEIIEKMVMIVWNPKVLIHNFIKPSKIKF